MQVVGVCLFKNEEIFLERSLYNVAQFCDKIFLLDNNSTDSSNAIARAFVQNVPHAELAVVQNAMDTHKYFSHYANTDTWLFAVDGDEIYDPEGLRRFRTRMESGEFDKYWLIKGHTLHTLALDFMNSGNALGFPSPPNLPATKLFNSRLIYSWHQVTERLHGEAMVFKPGYNRRMRCFLNETEEWDANDLHMLHTCFMPRTHLELSYPRKLRRQSPPAEKRPRFQTWKQRAYGAGEIMEVPLAPFFPDVSDIISTLADKSGPRPVLRDRMPRSKAEVDPQLREELRTYFNVATRGYATLSRSLERIAPHHHVLHLHFRNEGRDWPVIWRGMEAVRLAVDVQARLGDGPEFTQVKRFTHQIPTDTVPAGQEFSLSVPLNLAEWAGKEIRIRHDFFIPTVISFSRSRPPDPLDMTNT